MAEDGEDAKGVRAMRHLLAAASLCVIVNTADAAFSHSLVLHHTDRDPYATERECLTGAAAVYVLVSGLYVYRAGSRR